jgi:cobalt-zinc-cadmium efflux system membrane fusion protein
MKMRKCWLILLASVLIPVSCSKKSSSATRPNSEKDSLITVSQALFQANGMMLGRPQQNTFEDVVKAGGKVIASIKGKTQIKSSVSGTVKSIHRELGEYAYAGSVVCSIESNDYIVLQQEYNAVSNSYRMAKANYERLSALYRDNIASKNDFQTAESSYKSIAARYENLKHRLDSLKTDSKEIEKGKIFSIFPVRAPVGGYVTKIDCKVGEFVKPQKILMTLVEIDKVYLQLEVLQNDVAALSVGQKVEFCDPDNPDSIYVAQLSKIGKDVDPVTKSVLCIADVLSSQKGLFTNDLHVDARIVVGEHQGVGVPEEAVAKVGREYRVYELQKKDGENYVFKSVKVSVGERSNHNIELKGNIPAGPLLVKGLQSLPDFK